jgi:hypothetical protein
LRVQRNLSFYVGWKRHLPDSPEQTGQYAVIDKADEVHPLAPSVQHVGLDRSIGQLEAIAGPNRSRWSNQRLPTVGVDLTCQQDFDDPQPFRPAEEASRKDLGVVDHQKVPRFQQLHQIAKVPVLQTPGSAVEEEQPRPIAPRDGDLRDQLGREVIVEVGYAQRVRHGTKRLRMAACQLTDD